MPVAAAKVTPIQKPTGSTKERILAAAMSLISAQGYAATSVDAICAAAGVKAPTLYHHFGSKDGLLAAVVETTVENWYSELEDSMTGGEPSLAEFATTVVESIRANSEAPRVMLLVGLDRGGDDPEAQGAVRKVRQRAVELLASRIESLLPGFSGATREVEELARLIMIHLDGIFLVLEIDGRDDLVDSLLVLMQVGIAGAAKSLYARSK